MNRSVFSIRAGLLGLAIAAGGAVSAHSQGATEGFYTPLVDMRAIKDTDLRMALHRIHDLRSDIHEYSAVLTRTIRVDGQQIALAHSDIMYREPNLAFEYRVIEQSTAPGLTGQQFWAVSDGRYHWQYTQHAEGSEIELRSMLEADPNVTDIDARIADHLAPHLTRVDVRGLQKEGKEDRFLGATGVGNNPFDIFDPETLALVGESDDQWVFSGQRREDLPGAELSLRMTISKQHGLMVDCLMYSGQRITALELRDIQVNPDPPLADRYFIYTPPDGVPVQDLTKQLIES